MHARVLRYLDEVARSGSIRKAANRLNVASSAINRQILMLEEDLGSPIFERLPRGLRLTTAGEMLINHVRQTLKDHERVRARVEALKGLRRGEVTIVTTTGLAGGLLAGIIERFRTDHPGIKLRVVTLSRDATITAVLSGEADFALAYNLQNNPRLSTLPALRLSARRRHGAGSSAGPPGVAPPRRMLPASARGRPTRPCRSATCSNRWRGPTTTSASRSRPTRSS